MPARLRVTLRKSPISYTAKARGSVRALGLHRIGQTVEVADTPQARGMTRAIAFLLHVEELRDDSAPEPRKPRAVRQSTTHEAEKA
jgi:large subunit ribosomal protein L30